MPWVFFPGYRYRSVGDRVSWLVKSLSICSSHDVHEPIEHTNCSTWICAKDWKKRLRHLGRILRFPLFV